jgi:hypothetical protein
MKAEEKVYLVGKGEDGWVTIDIRESVPKSCVWNAKTGLDKPNFRPPHRSCEDVWGRALWCLWQHEALKEVAILTEAEWLSHPASLECGIGHIDLGCSIYHT